MSRHYGEFFDKKLAVQIDTEQIPPGPGQENGTGRVSIMDDAGREVVVTTLADAESGLTDVLALIQEGVAALPDTTDPVPGTPTKGSPPPPPKEEEEADGQSEAAPPPPKEEEEADGQSEAGSS